MYVHLSAGGGPSTSKKMLLGIDVTSKRARLNSHHLRELTAGRFLIKCEQITLLENIGQGTVHTQCDECMLEQLFCFPGEFGVVYKARLGPMGLSGREVAVKTLKG